MKICTVCSRSADDSRYKGPTCRSCYKKANYEKNKDSVKIRRMARYNSNKQTEFDYQYARKKKDPAYRASCRVRNRVQKLLKNPICHISTSIGCSQKEFRNYIESQFSPGMTWDNYGNRAGQWNIDHIYPLSKAYKEGQESFAKACHYTNLRPMWSLENRSKGNKTCSA